MLQKECNTSETQAQKYEVRIHTFSVTVKRSRVCALKIAFICLLLVYEAYDLDGIPKRSLDLSRKP